MTDRVLIVDDDDSICWVLQRALEQEEYQVDRAADAREALRALQSQEYPVVLLDIRLPGMSGLEALQQIREIRKEARVIVMTAQATMRNALEAMKQGAFDYITKPFDVDEILRMVARARVTAGAHRSALSPQPPEGPGEVPGEVEIIGRSPRMREVYKLMGRVAEKEITVLIRGESGTGKELVARAIHTNSRRAQRPFITVKTTAIPSDLLESELFGHEKGAFTGATAQKIGKFELADGGTVFLDEIGDMDLHLQSKILWFLQEKVFERVGGHEPIRVNVRVIAATHQDLEKAIREHRFREDLYYRLNVVPILLPPLRERKEDVPVLVDYFLKRHRRECEWEGTRIAPEALDLLLRYDWPGNVRELENAMKRAMVLSTGTDILPEALPAQVQESSPVLGGSGGVGRPPLSPFLKSPPTPALPILGEGGTRRGVDSREGMGEVSGHEPGVSVPAAPSLEEYLVQHLAPLLEKMEQVGDSALYGMVLDRVERTLITLALRQTRGNQVRAAELLGINRNTLRKKIQELRISLERRSRGQ
jgi:two-component system nitrogen regulation response regulator GlnG